MQKFNKVKHINNMSLGKKSFVFSKNFIGGSRSLKNKHQQEFSLSSLTPSTSFRLATGTGQENERKLIYTVLSKYSTFHNNKEINRGLKWLMIGNVGSWKDWQDRISWYESDYKSQIVTDVPKKFAQKLRDTPIESHVLKNCDAAIVDNGTGTGDAANIVF